MEAQAFAPGHITAFFVPLLDPALPSRRRGSRGAGFCVESGVTARARTEGTRAPAASRGPGLPFELRVSDNGRSVASPETTRAALRAALEKAGASAPLPRRLTIENRYSLPLGAGFGVSGACALAGVLAANEAAGLGLGRDDCVEAAHVGEVEALSGLGDVGPQSVGGFEVRTREGPPPLGEVRTFPPPARAEVLLVSFGPRPTREFLKDASGRARLVSTGEDCLARLLAAPSVERAVRLGRQFAEGLGLVSPQAAALLERLDGVAPASVAMLGDSVFALGGEGARSVAARQSPKAFAEVTRFDLAGARLL